MFPKKGMKMSSNTKNDKKIIELLEIMICPKTGGELLYDKDNQELVSKKGKLAYPIVDGIPVMLEDEARKIK